MKSLKLGQIRFLYIWVHPQWEARRTEGLVDSEIQIYKEFVNRIKKVPSVGLVQVADAPDPDKMKSPVYKYLIEKLKEVDAYASDRLGQRYLIWNEGRFIRINKNPQHKKKLVEYFNLLETTQEDYLTENERAIVKEPKYLAKVWSEPL